eukprot:CAMPEP_0114587990 /NCGR_PEP_ID=MMETSP0125-20121206/10812_1 /TAXON_ID=485358 ORGANISM="Aristerostoma sp., Strain ATCC 50986" /NCGR_SAMPLE_ID=MMETSP0125 /ASSEMBLY_ACC=CAM_ASM_000245 /LENGTH=90 /DNA_ID=CAMNT_0001784177 /DNA_START=83 /DNA_END=356 /DNA_ORIENTATION=-
METETATHVMELEDATNVMAEAKLLRFSLVQPDSARKAKQPLMEPSFRLALPAVVMALIIPSVYIAEEVEFVSTAMVKESIQLRVEITRK